MEVQLEAMVALVTGAASGIGRAIAVALAANHASVVCCDIDLEGARATASTFPKSLALPLDAGNPDEAETVVAQTLERFGRLDILVNNAGGHPANGGTDINPCPVADWDRVIRRDLSGLFHLSRASARPMVRQKSGCIIHIASVLGLVPVRFQSARAAAMAGVANLTKVLALELGCSGIRVNAIAPGSVATEAAQRPYCVDKAGLGAQAKRLVAHIPLGRPGTPEEIAYAALFLAAPDSSYVQGHILAVDGGWTAGYMREQWG